MPAEHDVLGTVYMKEEVAGVITVNLSPLVNVPVTLWANSTASTPSSISISRSSDTDGVGQLLHHQTETTSPSEAGWRRLEPTPCI